MKYRLITQTLGLFSFICVIYFRIYKSLGESTKLFWDSMVYYCAPLMHSLGSTGYGSLIACSETLVDFKFVYLPLYLTIFKFYFFSPEVFFLLWIVTCTLSVALIVYLLNRLYNYKNYLLILFITLFSFSGIPLYGYLSGNISAILYLFIILGIFLACSKKDSLIYTGLILIALPSLFKLHMILFLLVPYSFIDSRHLKKIYYLLPIPFLFVLANKIAYPELFILFNENISVLPYVGDLGIGSLNFINFINSNLFNLGAPFSGGTHNWQITLNGNSFKNFIYDFLVYFAILVCLTINIYKIRKVQFSNSQEISNKIKISISILAVYILIPRLKQYDLFLCAVSSYYLINSEFFMQIFRQNSKLIVFILNLVIIFFFNIKGDNYFIFPFISCIYLLVTIKYLKLKKINS